MTNANNNARPATTRIITGPTTTAQVEARWEAMQVAIAQRNTVASLSRLEYREEQALREERAVAFLEAEAKRIGERKATPVRRGYKPRFERAA